MTTTERNMSAARRVFEEVVNHGRLDAIDEIYAPDIIDHNPLPGAPDGIDGIRYSIGGMLNAMPDLQVTVEAISAHGDKVAVHNTWRGTQRGVIGLGGRGRNFHSTGVVVFQFEDGLIVERWAVTDLAKKMRRDPRAKAAAARA